MYVKIVLFFLFFVLISNHCVGQDLPPSIIAEGNQGYCQGDVINIVTSVSITDPDVGDTSLNAIVIQISEGYALGEDTLVLTGFHPNISSNWNTNQGELTLTGPATFSEFETAIEQVTFQTTQVNFAADKFFSINIGNANYLPSTGHYYFYVSDTSVTWNTAKTLAETQSYFGLQGYLATVTTPEESQLIGEQSPGTGWIGATDAETEGTWKWVTGPEAGTVIWIGQINGTAQNGAYTLWNTQEPNNFGGNEDYAHITDPSIGVSGAWNDLPNGGDADINNLYHPQGYLVEFGGFANEPEINLSASTKITAPKLINVLGNSRCGAGILNINLTTNTDNVLWFDSETAAIPINSGFTFSPSVNITTTYWVLPVFTNCITGVRIPVVVFINPIPVANNISITQCNDVISGTGFSHFNINEHVQEITGGTTNNTDVNYFLDAALTMVVNGDNYNNITNPQTLYAQVVDGNSGCENVGEVLLNVSLTTANNAQLEICDDTIEDGFGLFDLPLANPQILSGLPTGLTVGYYKSYEHALLDSEQLPNNFTNTVAYNQTIYARVLENEGCYAINEVLLIVNSLPNTILEETVFYCLNEYPETITLSSGLGSFGYIYNWSTNENTSDIQVNTVGIYTVTISDVNTMCSIEKTITVLPSNVASITGFEIIDISTHNSITILVEGEGSYVYALNSSNGPFQDSNVFENLQPGIFTVYIRDVKNNCGTIQEEVAVIGYPNVFTPNGDTRNDTWGIQGFSSISKIYPEVLIFNRYGKLVYKLSGNNTHWDGTFNGEILPASDYWFTLTLVDGRVVKGHFALKR